eukprot:3384279-Amphidinium_carterae.1
MVKGDMTNPTSNAGHIAGRLPCPLKANLSKMPALEVHHRPPRWPPVTVLHSLLTTFKLWNDA